MKEKKTILKTSAKHDSEEEKEEDDDYIEAIGSIDSTRVFQDQVEKESEEAS